MRQTRCRSLLYAIFGIACFGAASQASEQSLPDTTAAVYWNRMARDLVRSGLLNPPRAARVYAYTSIAQHSVLLALHRDPRWRTAGALERQLSRRALSTASKSILESFFPAYAPLLAETYRTFVGVPSKPGSPGTSPTEDVLAEALGQMSAFSVLRRANGDGATDQKSYALPNGPDLWRGLPDWPPIEPMWGRVRPLAINSADEVPGEEPPRLGSNAFREALAAVRSLSSGATREWLAFVTHWADDSGTATPAGHWNAIADEMIGRHHLDELQAAEVFALLNIALFDSSIVCWRMKYGYLYPRPSQIDPTIRTHLTVPNFPSFTSGHATFSGAASAILGFFFPAEINELERLSETAQLSRVYAGIHFPFDSEVGSRQGRVVARLVLSRYIGLAEQFYGAVGLQN
jgi:membrane-associated phospholipid phosphatase